VKESRAPIPLRRSSRMGQPPCSRCTARVVRLTEPGAAVGVADHEKAVQVSQAIVMNYPPSRAVANADAAGAG